MKKKSKRLLYLYKKKLLKSENLLNKSCDICGKQLLYCQEYDAVCCPYCDEWKEKRCDDYSCEYCRERPDKPSIALYNFLPSIDYDCYIKKYERRFKRRSRYIVKYRKKEVNK